MQKLIFVYLGYTSLIYASKGGHINVVRVLLKKYADVNAKDNNGKLVDINIVFILKNCKRNSS